MTADAATNEPIAIHFSGNDQYICVIKDEMFVLTHSASSQLLHGLDTLCHQVLSLVGCVLTENFFMLK